MRTVKDKVIIKADPVETRTGGGLIIPNGLEEKQSFGVVVAVGTDKETGKPLDLKPGTRVSYNKYAILTEFDKDGETYKVLRYDEVWFKVDTPEPEVYAQDATMFDDNWVTDET